MKACASFSMSTVAHRSQVHLPFNPNKKRSSVGRGSARPGQLVCMANAELSPEQKAFLERKKTGTMPAMHNCSECDGTGVIQCGQCLGTGMNPDNLMKKAEDQLVRTQGVNPFAFEKNAPCWLCRGQSVQACKSCGGTGFEGAEMNYIGD
eukprot:CAMPEP_0114238220 /NCGR_PEP_ID=MMETSP0058-20121206/7809_1 /TAXON_ID=36894 /ORGANISM="Pyramimonas parkeae, CCMP726" /LENGTH=149 /DNA_ID=CAMNT_0001350317 /DNA_START=30 /DNA_END=479 /DNA_ORIENTATION=-